MNRRLQIVLFGLGATGFALLVSHIGVTRLLTDARSTGWLFIPIVLIYGLVYLCNTLSWYLLLIDVPRRPPFWRLYAITVSGFALNLITPVATVGGEPVKIMAIAPLVGTRRAASSVVSFFMIHALGSLLTWITALAAALVILRHEPLVPLLGGPLLLGLIGLAVVVLGGHRHGVLERVLRIAGRLPLPARIMAALAARRDAAVEMDRQITDFYRQRRRRFLQALALDYLGRALTMVEYYLACASIGVHIGFGTAYMVGGLTALALNLVFWLPLSLGWQEGVLYWIFRALGLDPATGVYNSVVGRVREVCWIGVGLLLLWVVGRDSAPAVEPT